MTDSTLFLLFNHRITESQREDASRSLGVTRIEAPPGELQELWSGVPPELPALNTYLAPIGDWLRSRARPGDHVLIQGDFGACFLMVNFALNEGLVPVYSTTERKTEEDYGPDGSIKVVHHFRHTIYRKYGA